MTLRAETINIYYDDTPVVRNFTHTFARGKITALIGPNGAGKSSLLKCLAGVILPRSGSIERSAAHIGYLEQGARCHWNMQVDDVVALGRLPFGDRNKQIIAAAMAATNTAQFAARPIHDLSGGEQSRVMLARVLAGTPEWIFADEPLGHLDPAHQLDIMAVLRAQANGGAGVIIVMHDIALAARTADDIILMVDGGCVASGLPRDVITPENLRAVFGVTSEIEQGAYGLRVEITGRSISHSF